MNYDQLNGSKQSGVVCSDSIQQLFEEFKITKTVRFYTYKIVDKKVIEIDDEKRLQNLYSRRMAQEIDGITLGDEFKGYVFRISGGNDKQGFPMRQGVLTNTRVRLLCKKGHKTYRPRRAGERKRKSVRGCIVGHDIAVLNLVVTQIGDNDIPGLTDDNCPRRLGPKRANNIRKLFNLSKEDDVHCKEDDVR